MKTAALILATLALAAISEAIRVTGRCKIKIVHLSGFVTMDCTANLPDGGSRTASKSSSVQFPKICAGDDSICWQMNTEVPQNIDVSYANTVKQTTGTVSDHKPTFIKSTWTNTYDIDF